jgi:hypothetical protein
MYNPSPRLGDHIGRPAPTPAWRPVDRTRRGRKWKHYPGQTNVFFLNDAAPGYPGFAFPGYAGNSYYDYPSYGTLNEPYPSLNWKGKKLIRIGFRLPQGVNSNNYILEKNLPNSYLILGPFEMSPPNFDPTLLTVYVDQNDIIDFARYG